MEIVYSDDRVVVCIKPAGIVSTDEPGGLPDLVRQALGDANAVVRTVHRLDRTVSGLMVLARTARAAADLSAQIRDGLFEKEYMAVVHGVAGEKGMLTDYLHRDKARKMTFVVPQGPESQEAVLHFDRLAKTESLSLVRVRLVTGRTHQIRVQFSSRGLPLVGDRKYGIEDDASNIALWSYRLQFSHPRTGERMTFIKEPPLVYPWTDVKGEA